MALAVLVGLLANSGTALGASGPGACYYGRFGQSVDCGGGYVVPFVQSPPKPSVPASPTPISTDTAAPAISPLQAFQIACLANISGAASAGSAPICTPPTGPPTPQPAAAAPAPAPAPADYAVQFWRTIPLPVPRRTVPPGYAITGKPAYLVTNGTVAPPEYVEQTPLGTLTISASGQYLVDWGDTSSPVWDGPYAEEGQPWPDGKIVHTYDYAGTYTIQVEEEWSAVWHLAGATGSLSGLHTAAAIPNFEVRQLQAVVTN